MDRRVLRGRSVRLRSEVCQPCAHCRGQPHLALITLSLLRCSVLPRRPLASRHQSHVLNRSCQPWLRDSVCNVSEMRRNNLHCQCRQACSQYCDVRTFHRQWWSVRGNAKKSRNGDQRESNCSPLSSGLEWAIWTGDRRQQGIHKSFSSLLRL